jgi:hypothetical protein
MSAAWNVHLPTADQTCVRLSLRPRDPGAPWAFALALTELKALGATGETRFRALGTGQGEPLVASQDLVWRGCPLHVETVVTRDGTREAALALPSWDELCVTADAGEEDFWELVDRVAAAVDAGHGAVVDGEPLDPAPPASDDGWQRLVDRHLALLVPAGVAERIEGARAAHYRDLPLSGLAVLIR